jgi:hypothetical protein
MPPDNPVPGNDAESSSQVVLVRTKRTFRAGLTVKPFSEQEPVLSVPARVHSDLNYAGGRLQ